MRITLAALLVATFAAAAQAAITKKELQTALKNNPEVLIEAIKENKTAIFDIINQAGAEAQARQQKAAEEAEKKAFEDSFKNPLRPAIDESTRVRGAKDAKYTLVEYSDFQCPYCQRGFKNVEELMKKHGSDMRFVFKHLPLPFHSMAMPAAQWMEAVAMQSSEKAWKFHDALFENQDKLGADFFKKTAKDLGIDVEKAEKDSASAAVKARIDADQNEAGKFGFQGTPGYLLNGIPVKGAYPVEYFEDIIKKLDDSKKSADAMQPAAPKAN